MPNVLDLKKLRKEVSPVSESSVRPLAEKNKEEAREEQKTIAPPAKEKGGHETYVSWQAPEYERLPKKPLWFLTLGLVTLALTVVSFYFGNYLFAFFIVVAGILVGWFGVREPRMVHFAITSEGVQFENRIYLFDDLKSFWIFYEPPLFKELSVESKKIFMPYLRAPLGDTPPEKIREILAKFLPEEKQRESFITIISHLARF